MPWLHAHISGDARLFTYNFLHIKQDNLVYLQDTVDFDNQAS